MKLKRITNGRRGEGNVNEDATSAPLELMDKDQEASHFPSHYILTLVSFNFFFVITREFLMSL